MLTVRNIKIQHSIMLIIIASLAFTPNTDSFTVNSVPTPFFLFIIWKPINPTVTNYYIKLRSAQPEIVLCTNTEQEAHGP